jgi:quaternary ammonium compound-resistance protein SugE
MTTGWLILGLAVITEIIWALSLKLVQDHPVRWLVAVPVALTFVNMWLLSLAMRYLPTGTAYAVWTGLGVVGVTLGGIVWFGDPVSATRIVLLAIISCCVVGLKFTA